MMKLSLQPTITDFFVVLLQSLIKVIKPPHSKLRRQSCHSSFSPQHLESVPSFSNFFVSVHLILLSLSDERGYGSRGKR